MLTKLTTIALSCLAAFGVSAVFAQEGGYKVEHLNFADKALLADRALAAIDAILSDTAAGTLYFRRSLADYLSARKARLDIR